MSRPDATASAALDNQVIIPAFFAFLDFKNEPIRATTAGQDWTFTGTGIADLDGKTFLGIAADFVDISPVKQGATGSDSVTVQLSALIDLDNDMLNEIGDRANWAGRLARLWRVIRDQDREQVGGVQHYYTGYITDLSIRSEPENQLIQLTIESYVAAFSAASNRSYLNQELYDAGDQSARAAIDIANGTDSGGSSQNAGQNSTYAGGSRNAYNSRVAQ